MLRKIPFNRLIAIRHSGDSEYVLELDGSEQYLNHLNAVHASAQFALAEATSGEYLLRMFEDLAGDVTLFSEELTPAVGGAE
jgi:hypothetical protein